MKIFIVNTYYKNFLDSFYKENLGIENLSYNEHYKKLIDAQFGTSDFYSKNLNSLGHEAKEFIVNDEKLQKKWARERRVSYRKGYFASIPKLRSLFRSNWLEKIAGAQIAEYNPDIIYSHNLSVFSPDFIKKNKINRLFVGQIACPLPEEKYLKSHDLILTSFPRFVQHFKSLGIQSEYFRLGFEHTLLTTLKDGPPKHDSVFIGTFGSKHEMGTTLLEEVVQKTDLKIWGRGIQNVREDSPLQKTFQGEAWGHNMYQILHDSKIAINRHIDIAENYANNMRLYEATGVGSMLITDKKNNLGELFIPGKEVETYENSKELIEKINYYLKNEEKRKEIAKRGQARTLSEHSYKGRMVELAQILARYTIKK